MYFQKLALQHVFKKEGVEGQWLRWEGRKFLHCMWGKPCRKTLNRQSLLPWEQKGLDVEAIDWILAQQVRHESPKNKVEITPSAETVAVAAMLALSNTTNVVRSLRARLMAVGASHCLPRSWLASNRGKGGGGGQGRERMATTGEDNNNCAFPTAIKWW